MSCSPDYEARPDSPETLSKSCSDKLALKQCMGLLSSHTSCFISPENAYLTSLVVPESQYISAAMERCFGRQGRLAAVNESSWPADYTFRPFRVLTTAKEFRYSRRSVSSGGNAAKGSNLATIWDPESQEVIINGVLQGRKQTDDKCASMVSRSRLVTQASNFTINNLFTDTTSYTAYKRSHPQLVKRAEVKAKVIQQALIGWVANVEDSFNI